MFKKIKNYFSLQRRIQFEILETLCTICLYCGIDAPRNPHKELLQSHFKSLKDLSEEIRDIEWKSASEEIRKQKIERFNKYIF